jgi:hypothetical protein
MITTSIERLEQIELERSEVIANPAYQAWMRELNVSQSYVNPESRLRANELNNQYEYTRNKVARLELSSYL